MIYLVNFSICCVLFYFSNFKININLNNKFKLKLNNIFSVLGIILLSILSGLRAPSVGVDVTTYVISSFHRVSKYTSIFEVVEKHRLEIGYEFLEYAVSRFFNDVHWLHFFSQLIILSGAYSFSKLFKNTSNWIMVFFSFLCIYYNQSYNIVRQWLAISIYLFSIKYLLNNELKKYYFTCIIAYLFHSSAIIVFFIPLIYKYLELKKFNFKYVIFISLGIIVSFILLEKISILLIQIGIFTDKYEHYFVNSEGNSSLFKQILSRVPVLFGAMIFFKKLKKNSEINILMILFLIIDLIIGGFGYSKFGHVGRCSLYFGIWQCAFISQLFTVMTKNSKKKSKVIIFIIFVMILILYWYYYYVYRTFHETYPYVSDVLRILNF